MSLRGKHALVTGGGRGIGRGIALALAEKGCDVAIGYSRNRKAAEAVAGEVAQFGVNAIALKANLSTTAAPSRLVQAAASEFEGLDILVANAAGGVHKPLSAVRDKDWNWTMNINLRSILAAAQAAVPHMQRRGWGRILTVSSAGSRRVVPNYGLIGVSKAGLEALTRYLAVELAPDNIIVNCISPGLVDTDALDSFPNRDQLLRETERRTPTGRLASPEDIGRVAAWLCSDEAAMIVGQTIEIDGGYSLPMLD